MVFTSVDQSLLGPYSSSASTFLGMGRNRIINGEMSIDQANGGASISITGATKQSVDMIVADSVGGPGVFSIQRLSATPPTGFQNYLRATTTTIDASITAADYYRFYCWFEGTTIRDLQWGTASAKRVTVSFWARSSLTGTFGLGLIQNGPGRTVTGQYSLVANTWTYCTIPLPGDSGGTWNFNTVNSVMAMFFSLGVGSTYQLAPSSTSWAVGQAMTIPGETPLISTNGATLDITGLQFEIGSSATPFEYKPITIETQLCQRYYEKSYELDVAPGTNTTLGLFRAAPAIIFNSEVDATIPFKVSKRVDPSMIFWANGGTSGSWTFYPSTSAVSTLKTMSANPIGLWGAVVYTTGSPTSGFDGSMDGHWVADARL